MTSPARRSRQLRSDRETLNYQRLNQQASGDIGSRGCLLEVPMQITKVLMGKFHVWGHTEIIPTGLKTLHVPISPL
jgi:hypothetical protein